MEKPAAGVENASRENAAGGSVVMRGALRGLVVIAALLCCSVAAAGDGKLYGHYADHKGVPAAAQVEPSVPSSIELKVGQKRSFKGVNIAGTAQPDIVKVQADNNVLTLVGVKEGNTKVSVIGSGKPGKGSGSGSRQISVNVRR
jgi:hypothetical protein